MLPPGWLPTGAAGGLNGCEHLDAGDAWRRTSTWKSCTTVTRCCTTRSWATTWLSYFGADNARRILVAYRHRYRIFNDDMQGTGAIVIAGLLSALKVTATRWRDQRVVIFGGGTAGIGIADQIHDQMMRDKLGEREATRNIWVIDLPGLLTDDMSEGVLDYQRPYLRPAAEAAGWEKSVAEIDPSAAVRWPQMAALRAARSQSGIIGLQTVVGPRARRLSRPGFRGTPSTTAASPTASGRRTTRWSTRVLGFASSS
jgi:hypothetical protein